MSKQGIELLTLWEEKCELCNEEIKMPEGKHWRDIVAVGMKDQRSGNHSLKGTTSTNWADVYQCFANFRPLRWSRNAAIFFYFAELYHFPCKQHRDKEVALK
jgi:hypothetical protein